MARYSAVVDRLLLTVNDVKCLLGIPTSDTSMDAFLSLALLASKQEADEFLNNPFWARDPDTGLYCDPVVELPIPAAITEGILERIKFRIARANTRLTVGTTEEKLDVLGKKYAAFATVPNQLGTVQSTYWIRYRLIPGF